MAEFVKNYLKEKIAQMDFNMQCMDINIITAEEQPIFLLFLPNFQRKHTDLDIQNIQVPHLA